MQQEHDSPQMFHKVGDILHDGWIILGVSPRTHRAFSVQPLGETLKGDHSITDGQEYVAKLLAQGHTNIRIATVQELRKIWKELKDCPHDFSSHLGDKDYWGVEDLVFRAADTHSRYPGIYYGWRPPLSGGKELLDYHASDHPKGIILLVRDEPSSTILPKNETNNAPQPRLPA